MVTNSWHNLYRANGVNNRCGGSQEVRFSISVPIISKYPLDIFQNEKFSCRPVFLFPKLGKVSAIFPNSVEKIGRFPCSVPNRVVSQYHKALVISNSTELHPYVKLKLDIQWNLSIADMLYSGHLSIADTFFRNQLSKATIQLLHFEPLYSGHLFVADTFSEHNWCPLLRGSIVWAKLSRKI